jgi:hypothetical protein
VEKGLDDAPIFIAMSSGLRARADRARDPLIGALDADPLPTRRTVLARHGVPSLRRVWRGCIRIEA